MATRTTKTTDELTTPAGLAPAEAEALIAELEATPETTMEARELGPRERATAALLRERDHLDGCPSITDDLDVAGAVPLVEAYELVATAPASSLRRAGVGPGDPVIVVRCLRCAGSRHLASPLGPTAPVGAGRHVAAVLVESIRGASGAGELDTTL